MREPASRGASTRTAHRGHDWCGGEHPGEGEYLNGRAQIRAKRGRRACGLGEGVSGVPVI